MDTQKRTYRSIRAKSQAFNKFHSKKLTTTTLTKDPVRQAMTKEFNKKKEQILNQKVAHAKNDLNK